MDKIWDGYRNLKNLDSLCKEIERNPLPITNLLKKLAKKKISKMFLNKDTKLKLRNELEKDGEAILNMTNLEEHFFSAFRTLNITGDYKYENSPIMLFFCVFKSWFYHNMLFIAKNQKIASKDEEINFLKNKNFLSIWKRKNDSNDPEMIYCAKDPLVEYDRFLREEEHILPKISKVIDILYDMFILNNPESFYNHIQYGWKTKKDDMSIEEYLIHVKKINDVEKRTVSYLELIDEIMFEKEININYEFILFFSLQGILITLNTFIDLSKDYGNINLYNVLNKEFVCEKRSLMNDEIYINFIVDSLQNFFEFNDISKENTLKSANDFLVIFCSIFNMTLIYSRYPVLSVKDGVEKERMRIQKCYPAYELINRCKVNTVKSVNVKVRLYINLKSATTYYLYNDEELINFNLIDHLIKSYNILEFSPSLQQNLVNNTILNILECLIYSMTQIQNSTEPFINNNLQELCEKFYQNLERYEEYVQDFFSNIIPLFFNQNNSRDKAQLDKINKSLDNYQTYHKVNITNIFRSNPFNIIDEMQILNEICGGNASENEQESTVINMNLSQSKSQKNVQQTHINNLNHYNFTVAQEETNQSFFSPNQLMNEGYIVHNNYLKAKNNYNENSQLVYFNNDNINNQPVISNTGTMINNSFQINIDPQRKDNSEWFSNNQFAINTNTQQFNKQTPINTSLQKENFSIITNPKKNNIGNNLQKDNFSIHTNISKQNSNNNIPNLQHPIGPNNPGFQRPQNNLNQPMNQSQFFNSNQVRINSNLINPHNKGTVLNANIMNNQIRNLKGPIDQNSDNTVPRIINSNIRSQNNMNNENTVPRMIQGGFNQRFQNNNQDNDVTVSNTKLRANPNKPNVQHNQFAVQMKMNNNMNNSPKKNFNENNSRIFGGQNVGNMSLRPNVNINNNNPNNNILNKNMMQIHLNNNQNSSNINTSIRLNRPSNIKVSNNFPPSNRNPPTNLNFINNNNPVHRVINNQLGQQNINNQSLENFNNRPSNQLPIQTNLNNPNMINNPTRISQNPLINSYTSLNQNKQNNLMVNVNNSRIGFPNNNPMVNPTNLQNPRGINNNQNFRPPNFAQTNIPNNSMRQNPNFGNTNIQYGGYTNLNAMNGPKKN
jgi:hypothetical protein